MPIELQQRLINQLALSPLSSEEKVMKKIVALCFLVLSGITYCQPRNAGQAVVPKGWENEDSIRFGVFNIWESTHDSPTKPQADSLADSLQANFEHAFGIILDSEPYVGKRRGYMAYGVLGPYVKPDFTEIAYTFKQRVYYPSPSRIGFKFDPGYFWRYIDTNGYTWYENRYDANDVSPYAEFAARPSIVGENFVTKRFTGNDLTVKYGNEGRVVLGYSDNRLANELLKTYGRYHFPVSGNARDTAKMFTARLEFNIDTSSIDTSYSLGVAKNDLPLLRVQVAFKPAGDTSLPFVPFKTLADSTKAGWFIIADTTVTYNTYKDLYNSWRAEDTLANGNQARSWKFKQLHIPLKNMPLSMKEQISTAWDYGWAVELEGDYGLGSGKASITAFQHPDSLVGYDQITVNDTVKNLLEMRVLSTYRATVRVRSLCYQDTIADKFFYRRMFGDTAVHSCNPDGSYGGYDDSVANGAKLWADSLGSRRPREILVNDDRPEFSALSASACGYLDYMLSKYNIHIHVREQEYNKNGDWSLHFRRERMSHNGQPPSLYENQTTGTFEE